MSRPKHILLAVTGSVATVKLPQLCEELCKLGEVRVITTTTARHFIDTSELPRTVGPLLTDADEWSQGWKLGDPVLHIELRRWADVLVIAPLSANTLAKVACGMCDNLLTCVARAWDYSQAPLVVAPAMNTLMWSSPLTGMHLTALQRLGAVVVAPVSKKLACGDMGVGAMASPQAIAQAVQQQLQGTGTSRAAAGSRQLHSRLAWLRQVLATGCQVALGAVGAGTVLLACRHQR
mmetsp:Transcript_9316/g.23071  ORF Transcript_9316/g.23071 Transcript_9316/m.23071 type:complete len:235 (-) Transcript_9316:404-1108(-)